MDCKIRYIICMKLILILLLLVPLSTHAQTTVGEVTKLPIPRFVSLRGDQVFARTGPGTRYPIKWEYQRKNLPVEVVQEFDTWRKIRDIDSEEGWMHQSLLNGKRFAIHNGEGGSPLYRKPNDTARKVAKIESNALLTIDSCENDWCEVSVSGFNGWISLVSLWGVYEGERIE
jgi:SH3-like domain-containing protein